MEYQGVTYLSIWKQLKTKLTAEKKYILIPELKALLFESIELHEMCNVKIKKKNLFGFR